MLRSNPSARADARAWAAMLLSLLILSIHAWAAKAVNLLEPYIRTLPTLETPWLPFGKISGADHSRRPPFPVAAHSRSPPATLFTCLRRGCPSLKSTPLGQSPVRDWTARLRAPTSASLRRRR